MTDKPRAADDFEAIRARRDEIRREVDPIDIEVSEEERAAAEAYFADISEPEMIYVAPLVEVTVGPLTEVKKVDGD